LSASNFAQRALDGYHPRLVFFNKRRRIGEEVLMEQFPKRWFVAEGVQQRTL